MTDFSTRTGIPSAGSAARRAEQSEPRAAPGFRVTGGSAARQAGQSSVSDRPPMASILQSRKRERIFTPRPVAAVVAMSTLNLEREEAPTSKVVEKNRSATALELEKKQVKPGILKQFLSGIFSA